MDSTLSDVGVTLVRGAVAPSVVDVLRKEVDALFDELVDLSGMVRAPGGARFAAGTDHYLTHDAFRAFACEGAMPELAAQVLGSQRIWLYEDSVLVKQPGAPEETKWHTDEAYFPLVGEQVCTFWVPLDPATRETGALRFARGSHRSSARYRPSLFVTETEVPGTVGDTAPQLAADDPDVVTFSYEPGDVSIHHYRTLHGAPGNTGTIPRRAISLRYCGDDARWRFKEGQPLKPRQEGVVEGDGLSEPACVQVWPVANGRTGVRP